MPRKTLSDFDGDTEAYADYLDSADCANDDGYDIYADDKGNIYDRTDDDWNKGHGHHNINATIWGGRDKDDDDSKGKKWRNPWKVFENLSRLSFAELQELEALSDNEYIKLSARTLLMNKVSDEFDFPRKLTRR